MIVVAAISRRRWRCNKARNLAYGSPDCGPEGRTMSAGSGSPDRSSAACADETATDETLHGIVRIGASRQAQDQPGRDHEGDDMRSHDRKAHVCSSAWQSEVPTNDTL